jgi:integrase
MTPANDVTERKRRKRNRKQLTEESVLKLPTKRRQYMAWDTGTHAARGLGVLVSPTGTRSYRVVYRFPHTTKLHGMGLGRVGEIDLETARERAIEARRKASNGIDPKGDDVSASDKFEDAVKDYVRRHLIGKRGNVTALEVQRAILKACDAWRERPVATITGREIGNLLDKIRDGDADNGVKGRPYMANRIRSYLLTFFTWCVGPSIGKVKASPMVGIEKPFDKETPRDRWFKDEEIVTLWRAANKIGGVAGRFLRVLLLMGKRKGALSRMKWEHIDENWFWKPPTSESKENKKVLEAPLSSLVQRELGKRQAGGYVFPGPVEATSYDPMTLHHLVRRVSGIADFYPHALRHTAETKLAELRVPPHIRDLLFDHAPKRGTGARYDHHTYDDEMREATEAWAAYVRKLIGPKLAAENKT